MSRFGGAAAAATVLGVSRAQLDRMRAAATLVFDAASGTQRKLTKEEAGDRAALRQLHLIAPSLHAQKLPGGAWEYHLERLRRQREELSWE